MTPSPPSTGPSGSRARRSSAFVREHCRGAIPRRYRNYTCRLFGRIRPALRSMATDAQAKPCVSSQHRGSTTPKRRSLMSKSFPLPTEPEGVIPSLIERFNSGKVEAMMALYGPEAVVIAKDGRTITDRTEIAAQFQRDMSLGLPLKANARHVFVGAIPPRSWWTGPLMAKV